MEVARFQRTDGALQTKHLLNTLPVLAKPVVEIRAASDLTVFQAPMPLVPGFGLLPSPTIRSAVFGSGTIENDTVFSERVFADGEAFPRLD